MYRFIQIPPRGERIGRCADGSLNVPDHPIIPFIEGDGTGRDIVPVMRKVVDAAVAKAYGAARTIEWMEVYAGEKAVARYGADEPLPNETVEVIREHLVAIKGPLSAGVGGGTRSLSAALRLELDCYAQIRPVRYFRGAPSPLKDPTRVDIVVIRETSEDIYVGIEWGAGSPEAKRLIQVLTEELGVTGIRFPASSSIGIKPISREGSQRLLRRAIDYAIRFRRRSIAMVHKGTTMKVTEGWFAKWGYELVRDEYGGLPADQGAGMKIIGDHGEILIRDTITDAFMQQSLLRPEEFDVVATMSQNGDFISSALAAQIGGVGIAPGANMGDTVAFFEPNHGSAPQYAGKNMVNPAAEILSARMMLDHIGWSEAARIIDSALEAAIVDRQVTYDFARLMEGVVPLSSSAFGAAIIERM